MHRKHAARMKRRVNSLNIWNKLIRMNIKPEWDIFTGADINVHVGERGEREEREGEGERGGEGR